MNQSESIFFLELQLVLSIFKGNVFKVISPCQEKKIQKKI